MEKNKCDDSMAGRLNNLVGTKLDSVEQYCTIHDRSYTLFWCQVFFLVHGR